MNRSLQEFIQKELDLAELTKMIKSNIKEIPVKSFVILPKDINNIEIRFPLIKMVTLKNSKHKILFISTPVNGAISFSTSNKPDDIFWIQNIAEFLQLTTN